MNLQKVVFIDNFLFYNNNSRIHQYERKSTVATSQATKIKYSNTSPNTPIALLMHLSNCLPRVLK